MLMSSPIIQIVQSTKKQQNFSISVMQQKSVFKNYTLHTFYYYSTKALNHQNVHCSTSLLSHCSTSASH